MDLAPAGRGDFLVMGGDEKCLVEPRNSNTIVVPIIGKGGSMLTTIGLT